MKIACIGECMIELTQAPGGELLRGYGGDTLNTATYFARLGAEVDYVTALGDDVWSEEMIAAWTAEGIGTRHVVQLPGKLPGLYIIETASDGERRFHYWRDSSAARLLLDLAGSAAMLAALSDYDLVYFSGITLSLYDDPGRARLVAALGAASMAGTRIAFDTNFRPRNWPDRAAARAAYEAAFAVSDIVLASLEDLDLLYGVGEGTKVAERLPVREVVLKQHEPACRVRAKGVDAIVTAAPAAHVVDTTAAGDSFAAAYLAARLRGADPVTAAAAGHRLAGIVVGHRGAIIPRAAMSVEMVASSPAGRTEASA